ncbi:MAG TPA: FAD-binding oxidoreductase [Steroidobacteraceae bacterium]|jgi:FAD/FMN-containing dehydrogenase|nr:FAD-binding oxidoreductase [Steroidobacteraceae bacterium]
MLDSGLLADLRAVVGESGLLTGAAVHERTDVNGHVPRAFALVRPATTEQVSAVLRLCHARRQSVVTHGGRSGLVEGTATTEHELILSTERMNAIERVDVTGRTMRVQSGAILQRVQEEAERHDLMFALDLGGRGTCTIGGNISTNAGGVRVLRYGMMRALVLGVEAVLADGTVLKSLNRMIKNNAGYDLKQLFIGSEGTLGVITRADLRLFARPRSTNTALVGCADFDGLVKLLGMLDASLGGQLSAFEAMWPEFYAATTSAFGHHRALLPASYGIYGLVEASGADIDSDSVRFEEALGAAMEQGVVLDAVIAKSEAERTEMWAPRDDPWLITQHYGATLNFDVSMAIEDMADYLTKLRQAVAQRIPAGRVFAFGHIADGNLHVIVAPGTSDAAVMHLGEELAYELLRPIDGSISAEHGIGLERRHFLNISRTAQEIDAMRTLKHALDPHGILNPGKVFA